MKKTIIPLLIFFAALQINAQIQTQVKKTAVTNQQINSINNQKILNQTATKKPLTKPFIIW
jgi:hypothetical protein